MGGAKLDSNGLAVSGPRNACTAALQVIRTPWSTEADPGRHMSATGFRTVHTGIGESEVELGALHIDRCSQHDQSQASATANNASVTFSGSVIMRSWPVSMSQRRPARRASSIRASSRVASVEVQTTWYWGIWE